MNKQDFENLIKSKSVDELIEIIPVCVEHEKHEYTLNMNVTAYWHRDDVYYNVYYARTVNVYWHVDEEITLEIWDSDAQSSERDKPTSLKNMLLWLYGHNLLPEYIKDEN